MFGNLASIISRAPGLPFRRRLFRGIARYAPFESSQSFYGVRLTKRADDATYIFSVLGAYGTFISDYLKALDTPFLLLDVGANQGLYTLLAAANPQCVAVVSLEPNPSTYSYLVRNLAINSASNVTPICAALAPAGTPLLQFAVPSGHSGAANMFGRGNEGFRALPISKPAMAELLRPGEDLLRVCKIDVEGAEPLVLATLAEFGLLNELDRMIIEINEPVAGAKHAEELLTLLSRQGWQQVDRSGTGAHYDALFEHAAPTLQRRSGDV